MDLPLERAEEILRNPRVVRLSRGVPPQLPEFGFIDY